MTRTVSPGGTWSYYRTQVSGNHWQTKVTSPPDSQSQNSVGDDTVIDFQQDGAIGYAATRNFLETQRTVWQGTAASGTLLSTNIGCYNTTSGQQPIPANCPTASVSTPISRVTAFSYLPDTSSTSTVAETDTFYSYITHPAYPTGMNNYDYGTGAAGSLVRQVSNTYTLVGNSIVLSGTSVKDGSNNVLSGTSLYHNLSNPTPASGTPQHTAPSATAPYLTSLTRSNNSSTWIGRAFTYYDTGMLKTSTDWAILNLSGGPNVTTYNYDNTGTPSPSCGNSFVTSIAEPLSLSRSFTWDCNGSVQTSTTDENLKVSSVSYTGTGADASFWRPYGTTDQLSNTTTLSYPSNTVAESALLFNSGNSVVD